MIWSHLIGHELLKKQMEQLIISNQVPHAQLFTGLPGYGVLPLAIEFSLKLMGHSADPNYDHGLGKKSQQPDLHFVFPVIKKNTEKILYSDDFASEWCSFLNEQPYGNYNDWFKSIEVGNKQGLISVSEIERLHQKMYLKAFGGKQKVCIIWGVEKMNIYASNAFLKLLEEPPKNTFFILIAEDPVQILTTVKSRCQQINVGPIDSGDLKSVISIDHVNLDQIINMAEGNYSSLLQLLKQEMGGEHEKSLIMLLRFAFKSRGNKEIINELIKWANEVANLGREEQKTFLIYGIQFFRDAFLLNYNLKEIVHFKSKNNFDLSKFAPYLNNKNILDLISLCEKTHYYIIRNGNAKMLFTNFALKLTRLINLRTD